MLYVSIAELRHARARGVAVAAFSTYNLEITAAICAAAEATGQPVLLQAGASAFSYIPVDVLGAATLAAARNSAATLGVHLDHCRDPELVRRCIKLGYTSVMFDGSHLDFESNMSATREICRIAHDSGVWVEAELGSIPGDEDRSGTVSIASGMTDPDLAGEFVASTGVDCLAVAVGNVHGLAEQPVHLDLERLTTIAKNCAVPLVLHGASGLPDEELLAAVTAGVAKVNINTELRYAFLTALRPADPTQPGPLALAEHLGPARDAVQRAAQGKIDLLARAATSPFPA